MWVSALSSYSFSLRFHVESICPEANQQLGTARVARYCVGVVGLFHGKKAVTAALNESYSLNIVDI